MGGTKNSNQSSSEERRRNPSRPAKNTVSDIKEVFKKQMAASSSSNNNSEKSDKSLRSTKKKPSKANTEEKEENGNKQSPNDSSPDTETTLKTTLSQEDLNEHDKDLSDVNCESDDNEDDNEDNYNSAREIVEAEEESIPDNEATAIDEETIRINALPPNFKVNQDAIMQSLGEIKQTLDHLSKAIFDPKNGIEVQLGKTINRVDTLYTDIHGAVSGLKVRMDQAEEQTAKISIMESSLERISKMLDENKRITQDLKLMQGLIQKFSQQGQVTKSQILDLTKRGMEQNLVIHGLNETADPKVSENCRQAIIEFLQENMSIDIEQSQIWKAHRLGIRRVGHVRPMVAKFAYDAKEKITENFSSLKGKINSVTGKPLFISEQAPDGVTEVKKQVSARLKVLRDENDKRDSANKRTIKVQNDKIIIDGFLDKPDVSPPQPSELFPDQITQKKINAINAGFLTTEPKNVKNSQFIGLAANVQSIDQVNLAYKAAAQRFPTADHIMISYALKVGEELKYGNCDDGEYGGSAYIKKAMIAAKPRNVAVFVVRRYGGLHLGVDRFKSIEGVAYDVIQQYKALY